FYEIIIPRFINILRKYNIKASFFVVGKDLQNEKNAELVRLLLKEGHEIANHTYSHPFGMRGMKRHEKEFEIKKCEEIITQTIGINPVGFRAPGYDIDTEVLQILEDRGYLYDSSVFPTYLLPIYNFFHRLIYKENNINAQGMSNLWITFSPNKPYFPNDNIIWKKCKSRKLIELPLSMVPVVRLPFYANFHLSSGTKIFDLSLKLMRGMNINYLFHGIELIDAETDHINPHLLKHPNVSTSFKKKIEFYEHALDILSQNYRVSPLKHFAENLLRR
ncbi:MAG: polysaccharide deacetylase family protein, partial [Candidatus Hodarchaeota archaeon]